MKINWKIRLRNPLFLIQISFAILGPILAYFGLMWEDMTTWKCLFATLLSGIKNPVVVIAIIISIFNTVTDPTTKGIGDSFQARGYIRPR